jgi:hypothetical protein
MTKPMMSGTAYDAVWHFSVQSPLRTAQPESSGFSVQTFSSASTSPSQVLVAHLCHHPQCTPRQQQPHVTLTHKLLPGMDHSGGG